MNTPDLAQPMTDEEQYAAFVAQTDQPAQEAAPAAEPREPPATGQPRDESGRFAQRADGAPAPAQAEPEPFDGFGALPPDAQDRIRAMLGTQEQLRRERDSFRNRFSRANNDLLQIRRQSPPANTGHGRQTQPATGTGQQAQPGIAQARADVATMAPGAEREAANRKLDAWEKHAQAYPEDAAAIEQRVAALREDLLAGIAPQLQELGTLRAQVNDLRSVADQFRAEQATAQAREHQSVLDELVPGWRVVAGWQDANGNETENPQWHPAMGAWLDGHDPELKAFKLSQLANGSPRVAAAVIREFMDDFDAVSGETGQTAAPANPAAQRRAEQLRDVAPGGGANGRPSTPAWRQGLSEEEQYAAFIESGGANRR